MAVRIMDSSLQLYRVWIGIENTGAEIENCDTDKSELYQQFRNSKCMVKT
jgi:hypothetical protein